MPSAILVLLLVGAGAAAAWQATAPPPDPRLVGQVVNQAARPCSHLQVIGLRGHGDSMSTDQGLGADVSALVHRLDLHGVGRGADIDSEYALPYGQAPSVWSLPISVLRDLTPGESLLVDYVSRRSRACPSEERVVIGQSEGAAIAHLAYPQIEPHVAAVVLFGDPLHLGKAPYNATGGSAESGQLALWMGLDRPGLLAGRPDPISAPQANRVRSFCLPHDRVCAFDVLDTSPDEHLQYRADRPLTPGGPGVLELAGSFVECELRGKPPSGEGTTASISCAPVDFRRCRSCSG